MHFLTEMQELCGIKSLVVQEVLDLFLSVASRCLHGLVESICRHFTFVLLILSYLYDFDMFFPSQEAQSAINDLNGKEIFLLFQNCSSHYVLLNLLPR